MMLVEAYRGHTHQFLGIGELLSKKAKSITKYRLRLIRDMPINQYIHLAFSLLAKTPITLQPPVSTPLVCTVICIPSAICKVQHW